MDNCKIEAIDILDRIIIGRVEPHIYAFTTNTVPNYLKVGDTYRPVSVRLKEWREYFPELEKQYEKKAIINDEAYFRDYAVHQFLENDLEKHRLAPSDIDEGTYYSKEFFKDTLTDDVDKAIEDIQNNHELNTGKYEYYSTNNRLPQTYHYERGTKWRLRPNQKEAVKNFVSAVGNGRRNLLMYAVMRFGKSFTSLCCALEIGARLVLVVSAKADVKDEWRKTVEGAGNFDGFVFLEANDLSSNEKAIAEKQSKNKKVVVFLTLQDLQGETIKDKHKEIFGEQIDLLIVDETHFGARATSFGSILKDAGYDKSDGKNINKLNDETIDLVDADKQIKKINAKIRLHLSGTPYRILMGSEFEKEDIISFVQFSDIVKEQEEWDKENLNNDDINEWDNPYYGFPQMIRFAFNPSKSAREKMEALKKNGVSFAFSKFFEPCSIKKDTAHQKHKQFQNEKEILDLIQVIDGSKEDDNLLGFLDYDKIKEGKMCRHMVMVLPYCASCDAMQELLKKRKETFKNLGEYEIINISGVEGASNFRTTNDVKNKIRECESKGKKTLTLTVNRMLTGSTVEQWDTMLYFKDTASPQEYDQSVFRLQNQYVRTLSSDKGVIKEILKPQTLLVDFDPDRLFKMQEQKSLIYNVNIDENGNSKLKERIAEELRISPVIMMNHNKIKQVEATNILEAISQYNNQRSVSDEVEDLPIDFTILKYADIRKAIEDQAEFNSKQGMTITPNDGDEDDLDIEDTDENIEENDREQNSDSETKSKNNHEDEFKKLEKKIKTYYQRILFFSFLTKDRVTSIDDILKVIDTEENQRLAKNLYLDEHIIEKLSECMDPFKRSSLDYKIQNISKLASDETVEPLTRAMTSIKKFNRMSESEVITPSKVCDDMVNLIPKDGLKEIVTRKDKLLDIASKSGEYAVALYKRLTTEIGFIHDEVKNLIYSIPTSSIAYEFTRRFYEILGLNVDNIAIKFNAYDLIKVTDDRDDVDYNKINKLLKEDKTFSEITLKEDIKEGDLKVNFGAIIGNPPYQVSDGGAQASARPIYQHFVLLGKEMKSDYSCYITPTRWFAGGKGLDEFRNTMLNDTTIREIHDFLTPEEVFPNTNNRGGVCYFINETGKTNQEVRVITHQNNLVISDKLRKLLMDGVDIFIRDSIAIEIIHKIFSSQFDENISNIVSSRKPFGIESNIIKTNKFCNNKYGLEKSVICIGKNRIHGFIEREEIKAHKEWIESWKVYVPRANNIGTELNDDNLNSFVGQPNTVCTESYIAVGADINMTEIEATNLAKYFTTKFVRFLHKQAKASQDASSKTYRFIPVQNFNKISDIDWNKSIDKIDKQLFSKYGLTEEEKKHIKSSIKSM
ncbi:Eco57I restriction-modification methylase domain-containing protein [Clostridium algidicarnis]|uniref:Eco57I restriction-modification methylase domain-containing protein n=1 Tax=Clostridium algidicarnis TaxID=37659 RepID=UPI001C0B3C74|nr:Eco57I restriction-modification methylase domain-containing protein [Clostridium algidicarnis]MBU3227366.1 Eco57I restriction-modification methylase domain-containing protein [Clostridium algidicarnis]MBU3251226.1 Eco57I restriction-modification methylase domain-containing protein [Clostridium algidicarnis]